MPHKTKQSRLLELRAYCSQFEKELDAMYTEAGKGELANVLGQIANNCDSNTALIDKAVKLLEDATRN